MRKLPILADTVLRANFSDVEVQIYKILLQRQKENKKLYQEMKKIESSVESQSDPSRADTEFGDSHAASN